jgi:actin-related protein
VVQNWDDMEKIYRYIFEELKVNPKEHPVLLTEPVLNPIGNRIRMAQMMFDNFGVPVVYFQNQSVLSLYARGMTTGVVLDCGDGVTTASAIYEGYSIANATQRMDLGGRDVTQHLMQLLRRAGYPLHTSAEFEIVRQIKEKCCSVEPFNSAQSIGITGSLVTSNSLTDNRFSTRKDEGFSGENRFNLKKDAGEKDR